MIFGNFLKKTPKMFGGNYETAYICNIFSCRDDNAYSLVKSSLVFVLVLVLRCEHQNFFCIIMPYAITRCAFPSAPLHRYFLIRSPERHSMLFVMIGFTTQDGHGTVKLFDKEQPHHLMTERHTGERKLFARTVVDCLREAVRTAHDKHQAAGTGGTTAVNIPRKVHRTEFLTALIEQHHPVSITEATQYQLSLAILLLLETERLGILEFGNDLHTEWDIMPHALGIVGNEGLHMAVGGLAYNDKMYFHNGNKTGPANRSVRNL